jgi:uncharacterized protein (TIGR02231 family)
MDFYRSGVKVVFEADAAPDMVFHIPSAFSFDSVKPLTASGITLDYFQKRKIINNNTVPDTLKELDKKIKEKEREIDVLSAQIAAGKKNLEMMMNLSKGEVMSKDPVTYIKSLMGLYSESSVNINLFSRNLALAEADLAKLNEMYRNNLPADHDQLTEITMGVRGAGKVKVEAYSYDAGWTPSYRMNLNGKTGEIKSTFAALAHQKTGITYSGEISFFTQNLPSGYISVPKASPLVVDFRESPAAPAMKRMSQANIAEVMEPYSASEIYAEPVVYESLTNFSVKGRGRVSGDGAYVTIDLGNYTYRAELKATLFRDYSQEGYLVAKLSKIAEPMLPGYADLSVDGQSSGNTNIKNYGRGDDVEIPFGLTPLIRVNKTTNVTKSGGSFITGAIQDGYILEAVNGSQIEAEIELIDRIPFAANDKITVDQISINPPPEINKENVLTWKMKLKPGETKKFTVNYRIKYPSNKQINYR